MEWGVGGSHQQPFLLPPVHQFPGGKGGEGMRRRDTQETGVMKLIVIELL